MVSIDQCAPVRFLQAAFDHDDSIGVLLKTYRTGQVIQRIVPVTSAISDRFQAWLRHMNAHGWNVYVGVNAYRPGRSRAREAVPSGELSSTTTISVRGITSKMRRTRIGRFSASL